MNVKQKDAKIPGGILTDFQDIVDVLVQAIAVPAALIMRFDSPDIEVLCAGEAAANPYKPGDRYHMDDPFCHEIFLALAGIAEFDALADEEGAKSFTGKGGMVSCIGASLVWPDKEIFGIICVMDTKKNHYTNLHKKLLSRFKREVEIILQLMYFEIESAKNKIDLKGAEDKLKSVGILAGGIAQDFNSLLSIIIGNISLARMEVPPGDKVYDLLLESEKASCRAADIAEKLITFSEGGWLIRREENMDEILHEVIESHALQSRLSFNINIQRGLPSIFVDEGQFQQVLLNILLNAAEAMPGGGEVRISALLVTIEKGDFPPLKPGEYIKMAIKDHGPGIPKAHLDKIFDPYFSTKNSVSQLGMGLGLSICYSIIKKHEGWIAVESVEGGGTTVYLYIPVFDENSEKKLLDI